MTGLLLQRLEQTLPSPPTSNNLKSNQLHNPILRIKQKRQIEFFSTQAICSCANQKGRVTQIFFSDVWNSRFTRAPREVHITASIYRQTHIHWFSVGTNRCLFWINLKSSSIAGLVQSTDAKWKALRERVLLCGLVSTS